MNSCDLHDYMNSSDFLICATHEFDRCRIRRMRSYLLHDSFLQIRTHLTRSHVRRGAFICVRDVTHSLILLHDVRHLLYGVATMGRMLKNIGL